VASSVFNERSALKHADIEKLGLLNSGKIKDDDFALKYGLIHKIENQKLPASIMTWNIAYRQAALLNHRAVN
jgi:hypothetical protein